MKFWEAMRLLQEGRKVRCIDWGEGNHLSREKDGYFHWKSSFRYIDSEWELYEEPAQLWSFAQVLDLIQLGGKFARKGWTGRYMHPIQKLGARDSIFVNGSHETLTIEDYKANDWYRVE